jgi:hypothetical protein
MNSWAVCVFAGDRCSCPPELMDSEDFISTRKIHHHGVTLYSTGSSTRYVQYHVTCRCWHVRVLAAETEGPGKLVSVTPLV